MNEWILNNDEYYDFFSKSNLTFRYTMDYWCEENEYNIVNNTPPELAKVIFHSM